MTGLLRLIQLILSLCCGLYFWATMLGKTLAIITTLLIVIIIYRAGKIMGEKHNGK